MQLRITKNTGKAHIILYQRNDGSETWMSADDFFVLHDLSHYAIEKTLGYTTAFMGMLNNGMDIKDFENREKRKQIVLTKDACYAENMANLFLIETTQGNFDDFNQVLKSSFVAMSATFPVPVLSSGEIQSVRNYLRSLIHSWRNLPVTETLSLTFEL